MADLAEITRSRSGKEGDTVCIQRTSVARPRHRTASRAESASCAPTDPGQPMRKYASLARDFDEQLLRVRVAYAERDVEYLTESLNDRSVSSHGLVLRAVAARLVGKMRDSRGVGPLSRLLSDSDWLVRDTAARALGRLGEASAVPDLIAATRDEAWQVRHSAAIALSELGDSRATPALVLLAADDDRLEVRRAAVRGLRRAGDERALSDLSSVRSGAALRDKLSILIAMNAIRRRQRSLQQCAR